MVKLNCTSLLHVEALPHLQILGIILVSHVSGATQDGVVALHLHTLLKGSQ